MSYFCIYEKSSEGSLYDPPEYWCELGLECDCSNCSHKWSQEDYEYELADRERDDMF